ncbi:hypothetical protein [Pseudomonas sp. HLT2-19-2]
MRFVDPQFGFTTPAARFFTVDFDDNVIFGIRMSPVRSGPAQASRSPRIFRLVDSITAEPLAQQRYIATVDGQAAQRRTDGEGIAHLFAQAEVRQISMEVIGV